MFDEDHLSYIGRSLKLNYKSWIMMLVSCLVLSYNELFLTMSIIQYVLSILYLYLAHRVAHWPIFFLFNRAHIYHHENTDWFSHAIQVCIEISTLMSPTILIYYTNLLGIIDPFICLFFTFLYITIHNVNYGYFKINNVHSKHHEDYNVNYGPEICDIIFKTKYPNNSIENTDHFIPNIILSTLLVYLIRHYYKKSNNKSHIKYVSFVVYVIICLIVVISSLKQLLIDINKESRENVKHFDMKINKIEMLLHKFVSW